VAKEGGPIQKTEKRDNGRGADPPRWVAGEKLRGEQGQTTTVCQKKSVQPGRREKKLPINEINDQKKKKRWDIMKTSQQDKNGRGFGRRGKNPRKEI